MTEVPKTLVKKGESYAKSVARHAALNDYELDYDDIRNAYMQGAYDALNMEKED